MFHLSDVEISNKVNTSANSAALRSQPADDDDDDEDDTLTYSGAALTIKSSRQPHKSHFTNIGDTAGHATTKTSLTSTKPYFTTRQSPRDADNNSCDIDNESCVNPLQPVRLNQPNSALPGNSQVSSHETHSAVTDDDGLGTLLAEIGLGKYADIFRDEDVDLPMFLTLNDDDLKEIGIR